MFINNQILRDGPMSMICEIFKTDPGPVISSGILSAWRFFSSLILTFSNRRLFWLFCANNSNAAMDKIPENTLHLKVASLYPCDNSCNCSVGALNFSFLALELTAGLSFFLQEVSSCPPFSGRLLTDKLRAFGKMLSSSRAHLQL